MRYEASFFYCGDDHGIFMFESDSRCGSRKNLDDFLQEARSILPRLVSDYIDAVTIYSDYASAAWSIDDYGEWVRRW